MNFLLLYVFKGSWRLWFGLFFARCWRWATGGDCFKQLLGTNVNHVISKEDKVYLRFIGTPVTQQNNATLAKWLQGRVACLLLVESEHFELLVQCAARVVDHFKFGLGNDRLGFDLFSHLHWLFFD